MKKTQLSSKLCAALACGTFAAAATAQAGVSITNGDFENDAVQTSNVDSWFDTVTVNTANWWESAWAGPTVSPNGTSVLGLSYNNTTPNWAYQGIGVNDGGLTDLDLRFDVGSFTDAFEARDMGITLSVYQSDGSFVGADNTDVDGAAGITLIDSVSLTSGSLNAGDVVTLNTSLDLATANLTDQLYLRVINYATATGQPWAAVDNLLIVPEPASFALAGFGMAALLVFRRRQA